MNLDFHKIRTFAIVWPFIRYAIVSEVICYLSLSYIYEVIFECSQITKLQQLSWDFL